MGVICVNANGEIGISFNSKRMHCVWMSTDISLRVKIY